MMRHLRVGINLNGAFEVAGCFRVVALAKLDVAQAGKTPSADLYRGPLSVYLDAGFKELSRTSPSWVLVTRAL